ncbi:hypothetical protein [Microbacterium rhizomatis]|uniref:Uncharacterized protein n=1 Tax=Microbacterium rhizomatis TaxID=1631477 RepID=A0A5J5IVV5_9MICO|nr:hypothetical protein [Microbacterium rhizomatis]KAA9104735.1 hypothetical protein F6B43_18830 [Microbacterium rhizomatis]
MVNQDPFRRLLRWYPRAWRDRNGDVLLGVMLDAAEQTGRNTPTLPERWSVITHGLGTRLDRRVAFAATILALVTAAATGVFTVWGTSFLATATGSWLFPALAVFVGLVFVVAAVSALARDRGLLTEPRAVITIFLATLALAVAALAQISWSLGFDAADQGVRATGLAAAWLWLFVGAWAIGAAAIGFVVDALLRRTRIPAVVLVILAVVAGALLAPAVGLSLISPYTVAIAASVLAVAVVWRRTVVPAPRRAAVPPAETKVVPARTRGAARLLAAISAVASGLGAVFAVTGSAWGPASDGTEAMAQGISLSLIAALPLIAAIGISAVARGRVTPLQTWGPLMLAVLAVAAVAVAYRGAPAWENMAAGFAVGSVLGGGAIAWWSAFRLPGSVRTRVTVAVLIGVVYAAFLGILIAPMLAFILPVLAAAFAIWTPGRLPRPSHAMSSPASSGPLPRLS